VQFSGGDESKILADAQEPALRQVRMDLAVEAIVKAENIEATDEEIEAEMKKIADNYGMDLENVKKYLRTEDVKEQVVREKVIKLVADSAVAVDPVEEKKEEKTEE
jgi:trigger factor